MVEFLDSDHAIAPWLSAKRGVGPAHASGQLYYRKCYSNLRVNLDEMVSQVEGRKGTTNHAEIAGG